ncbi:DUF1294 domain-containing protein [Cohnella hongkongensis]|uniref:DUF1294 domain-containing protein n=1 Tax=Cohnella hongkongensis TaxID=178337 RepID=A0ABV9FJ56_9BACL
MYAAAGYWIVVNVISFYLMGRDKAQAKKGGRRIPERTLFLWAAAGGAAGAIAGMRAWRHKTKHASFLIGMPAILAAHLMVAYWFWR